MQMWFPVAPTFGSGSPFLCEIEVADRPALTWLCRTNGTSYIPQLEEDSQRAIETAQEVAHFALSTSPRASRSFQHWRGLWTCAVLLSLLGLLFWGDWALDGRPPWIGSGTAYHSRLWPPGYDWHWPLPGLCLVLGLVGGTLPLLLHLDGLKHSPPKDLPKPSLPCHDASLSLPWAISEWCLEGPSLGAAFYLATLQYGLEQWAKKIGKARLPTWGQELLKSSPVRIASAEVTCAEGALQDGALQGVAHWPEKLKAIHNVLHAPHAKQTSLWLLCASDDKGTVGTCWGHLTEGPALCWQPVPGTGCHRACWQQADKSVTFLACPTTQALLAFFDPAAFDLPQQCWRKRCAWMAAGLTLMGLAGLGALPFLQPYCPQPGLTVWFPGKLYHLVAGETDPRVKLAPEEASLDMGLLAWECGPAKHARWSVQAASAVVQIKGTPQVLLTTDLGRNPIECTAFPPQGPWLPPKPSQEEQEADGASPQWITLRPPQGTAVRVIVRVYPEANCPGAGMETSVVLLREGN